MSIRATQRARRRFAALAIALAAVIMLAACGSSGSTSEAITSSAAHTIAADNPARIAPASSVLFADVNLPPGSDQLSSVKAIIDKFGGQTAAGRIFDQLKQSVGSNGGGTYQQAFAGWFEGKFGISIIKWPAKLGKHELLSELVAIFPTSNPSLAKKDIPALEKGEPHGTVAKLVGDYLLIGGTKAVAAAAASTTNSIADSSRYEADWSKLPAGSDASVYVDVNSLVPVVSRLVAKDPDSKATLTRMRSQIGSSASEMLALSTTAKTISFDLVKAGITRPQTESSAGVAGLPAASWLALALPGVGESALRQLIAQYDELTTRIQLELGSSQGATFSADESSATARIAKLQKRINKAVDKQITSGLGPTSFALSGTSLTALKAGLLVQDAGSAGKVLLSSIYKMVSSDPRLNISGSPKQGAFSIGIGGLLTVHVSDADNRLLATLGYGSSSQFTSPTAKLADMKLYKQALTELPAGSKPSVFLNFSGLSLLSSLASLGGGGAQATQVFKTIDKLRYLIVGGSGSVDRLVLGLR